MATRIQVRRDLAANWTGSIVLASGEIGYETDTGNIKIGDGTTTWSSLGYYQFANVSVDPTTMSDLNNAAYRVMGRYRLNTVTSGMVATNGPSDLDAADSDSYCTLIVTTHAYAALSTLTQQILTQFSSSGTTLKQWVRIYDGTNWTAWTSTAHLTDNEVVTAKIDALAVTTAKIDNLAVTTAKIDNLGVTTAKIADDAVTDDKIRNSAAVSVIGRSANSSGGPADIAAGSNDTILRRVSDTLSFGQVTNGMVPTNTVGLDKLVNMAGVGLLGATAAGAVSALTTQANILDVLDGFGVVHTDNTKVGCIGFAVINSSGTVFQYPASSFTSTVVSTNRFPLAVAGTWQTLFIRLNTGGAVGNATVFSMTTTTGTNSVNTAETMILVAIRTA